MLSADSQMATRRRIPDFCDSPLAGECRWKYGAALVVTETRFRLNDFRPDDFRRSGIARPDFLSRAVPKRQAEYLAGRLCAREAIRLACGEAATPESGEGGAPVWPGQCTGSISHTLDLAMAVAGPADRYRGMGLDAEIWLGDAPARSLVPLILTPAEQSRFGADLDRQPGRFLTKAFSIKEALFKALYPLTGQRFYFQDAELIGGSADGEFQMELLVTLSPGWLRGSQLIGQVVERSQEVVSLVVIPVQQQD